MEPQTFKSPISYSVQNEDYKTEQAVLEQLERKDARRILMVSSSGENALSLLTDPTVASVDAVDLNPAQVYLSELRQVATEQLSLDEQLTLLGCNPESAGTVGAAERLALFDRVRPHLSEPARQFWEGRRATDIAYGVHHTGSNDQMMRDIAGRLRAAGIDPLGQILHEAHAPAWKEVYTRTFTNDYIREHMGVASEALAARIAAIAGRLGENHFRAAAAPNAAHNYFVTTVFGGTYAHAAGPQGYPRYLQPEGQQALRDLGIRGRLRLHSGNIFELIPKLAAANGGFDLISISNIADWMTEADFRGVVMLAVQCLNPDGVLLARTATGRSMLVDVMRQHMYSDVRFNMALAQVERGPWFRVIAAGFNE
jgi:S-adenosylmethionine:diacylglycerol 3-amino-3-carboxypropyl transferase